jgi:hypothetical protein
VRKDWLCLTLFLVAASAFPLNIVTARNTVASDAILAKRIENSPVLPLKEDRFQFRGLPLGWVVGLVSGVAADENGIVYIM